MLLRIILLCLLGGSILPAMAVQSHPEKVTPSIEKKVIELERSMAILQVSTASTDDYQTLETQLEQLQTRLKEHDGVMDRVDFLSNLVFLLFVALLLCLFHQRRHSRQLTALLKAQKNESSP